MWKRVVLVVSILGCGDKAPATKTTPPPVQNTPAATADRCTIAVDKLFAMAKRMGREIGAEQRSGTIEECRTRPADDPTITCLAASNSDDEIHACMKPKPKGEPGDQLDAAVDHLRTYFFIHETFTLQKIALTPAKPCCQFPANKCPPEPNPDAYLRDIVKLDFTTERAFQYRFESDGNKAVLEAIGDRDCDGKTVTYRRELELRNDGNMHITVTDPPADSD
jgi:hypothetical protein